MKKVYLIILVALVGVFFYMDKSFYFAQDKEAKILFVGDMMFDRYIRQVGYNKGEDYVFSCVNNFLRDFDLVIGNLEGPITENASVSIFTKPDSPDNYRFTFPSDTAKILVKNNIKLVNLGNNHIGNFGQTGIDSTKKFLKESGVNYIDDSSVYITKIGGQNISFISYNEFEEMTPEKFLLSAQ